MSFPARGTCFFNFTAGLALFLAITLPWHLYSYLHFGQSFLHDYFGFHTLTRATSAIEGHKTHPWFYLWVLLISAPPFALLYPLALIAPFRQGTRSDSDPAKRTVGARHLATQTSTELSSPSASKMLRPNTYPAMALPDPLQALAAFALVAFLLFSAAGTRLPHYIAPTYPAFSALTAALMTNWLQRWAPLSRAAMAMLTGGTVLAFVAAALLTERPRRSLHNPQLLPGYTTPDNRESVALLDQLRRLPPSAVPPGPLLVWRQAPVVPLTTDAFYARRLALQVADAPAPANLPPDPYFNSPQPLAPLLQAPHLLLLDRALLARLPSTIEVQPVAVGRTEELVAISPKSH